jgi:poly(3-hydroxybutyrate) depolymerase
MYEPAGRNAPNLALLWPAFAAASASEMAAFAAKQFTDLAVGLDGPRTPEPQWATPHAVALEMKTARLRDFTTSHEGASALICAPYALHSAVMTDLAPGHSLVAALRGAGLQRPYVVDWRSASADMRFLGIDDYLADLNVLIDEIGSPVDLIGMCQGGWLALVYAARFPAKVRKLVLAGAPVDITAAPSALSVLAEDSPLAIFRELVRLGDGLVPGRKVLKFWGPQAVSTDDIRHALQIGQPMDAAAFGLLEARFRDWYAWTVDLPGGYFLDVVDKIYKRNEIAAGRFVALGQKIDVATVHVPIYLLAARDDELVAPAQLFAVERLVGSAACDIRKAIAPCRHLGLFMGKRILEDVWPAIARWLAETAGAQPRPTHSLLEEVGAGCVAERW